MYGSDKYCENVKTRHLYARQSTHNLSGCGLELFSVLTVLDEYFVPNKHTVFKYFLRTEVSYGHFLPRLYGLPCIMFRLSRSTPCSFCSVNVVAVSVREYARS